MKWISLIVALMLALLGVAAIVLLLFRSPAPAVPSHPTVLPQAATSNPPPEAATAPAVQQAFTAQIQNADKITIQGSRVVENFALVAWGDENKGGSALLEYDTKNGWKLLSLGGGVWDVNSLTELGVPQATAQRLVAP